MKEELNPSNTKSESKIQNHETPDHESATPGYQSSSSALPDLPSVTMPKGGGAIKGIGEKFDSNPLTGTANYSVPIPASTARPTGTPSFSLSYDSGAGNGDFGLGWSVSIPRISRKTDKGLPRYDDIGESDTFVLAGAEDLVPVLTNVGGKLERVPSQVVVGADTFIVESYEPRIEASFSRIERWTDQASMATHWRVTTKDNISSIFGLVSSSQIACPDSPNIVFAWLLTQTTDCFGNAIYYEYKREDSTGISMETVSESNRTVASRAANLYPKLVRYGNKSPYQPGEDLSQRTDWMFDVVFDYGEQYEEDSADNPTVWFGEGAAGQPVWSLREDPFSTNRSGFEVRTYRLCRNILVFHHFQDQLGTPNCLVKALLLGYDENPIGSKLTSITSAGYVYQAGGTYLKATMPAIEFTYSEAVINSAVQEVSADELTNLPEGADGSRYRWLDLEGEGLSGVLSEQGGKWFYKRNLSALPSGKPETIAARFGPTTLVSPAPSIANLGSGAQQFLDLDGSGHQDLIQLKRGASGYFERALGEWSSFRALRQVPVVDWNDPNLKFIDITGDGRADIVISEETALTWYECLGREGYGNPAKTPLPLDSEVGPHFVFADAGGTFFVADMDGDGLADIVRIRNGQVCYWSNMGYGTFGPKVTMDGSPIFDYPDCYDPKRIRLGDIDGSGTTDIVYLGADGPHLYFNQSGNRFSEGTTLPAPPAYDNLTSVTVLDLLGSGTACLVWSSPLLDRNRPMRYIDLMGGIKPHLMLSAVNNRGSETHIEYAPSTRFYLRDEAEGNPWVTKLPFPVQVVAQVETLDRISGNRFVSRYAYHHGYFDGPEREFRGFGMVEHWDTEEYSILNAGDQLATGTNYAQFSNQPPIHTRTWFHTGAYIDGDLFMEAFRADYWNGDPNTFGGLTSTSTLPSNILPEDTREAARALKGQKLREEIYAVDGTPVASVPYSINESSYTVTLLQERGPNLYASFFTKPRESVQLVYDRVSYVVSGNDVFDPRIQHHLILELDLYGNVLQEAAIAYGRRYAGTDPVLTSSDQAIESQILATYTQRTYSNAILQPDSYRLPALCDEAHYQLFLQAIGAGTLYDFDNIVSQIVQSSDGAHDIAFTDYEGNAATPGATYQRRISEERTLFRSDDLASVLPLGTLEGLGILYQTYKLALTADLVQAVYNAPNPGRVPNTLLSGEAGYVHSQGDSDWWAPSALTFFTVNLADLPPTELAYAKNHFFLPLRHQDPFGNNTTVSYDQFDLLLQQAVDPVGNITSATEADNPVTITLDYRVLRPYLVTDPNGNRTWCAFDALGMVVGTAVLGQVGQNLGDTLASFNANLSTAAISEHFLDPLADEQTLIGTATTRIVYDLAAYANSSSSLSPQPCATAALTRETHVADLTPGQQPVIQQTISYSDGFDREIQAKAHASAGPVVPGGPSVDPRWIASGWTIFDNKGQPVRKYEPFYTNTSAYEDNRAEGVSSTLLYDSAGRNVAVLHPNQTYQKTVFDCWRKEDWDTNDTVLTTDPSTDPDVGQFFARLDAADYMPTWYSRRQGGALGPQELAAANQAKGDNSTPAVSHFDSLGRPFLMVADNGGGQLFCTRFQLDMQGNKHATTDALNRVAEMVDYSVTGEVLHLSNMEAGERWTLSNVIGKPIRHWNSRNFTTRTEYDAAWRPTHIWMSAQGANEILCERMYYGESANAPTLNLRVHLFRHYDQSGVSGQEAFDFKGSVLQASHTLALDYSTTVDWSALASITDPVAAVAAATGQLDPSGQYLALSSYDAVNRPLQQTTPCRSGGSPNVYQHTYDQQNLLVSADVWIRQPGLPSGLLDPATATQNAVTNVLHNARGQRTLVSYGNSVTTTFSYDPFTLRLTGVQTARVGFPPNQTTVQDLTYTYDAVGNIIHVEDDADSQNAIYLQGQRIDPSGDYIYDPTYRLISATGREQLGQLGAGLAPPTQPTKTDSPRTGLNIPGNGNLLSRYTEQYSYDGVGNLLSVSHSSAPNGSWNRLYLYAENSQIDPSVKSNRLSGTSLPNATPANPYPDRYTYDWHGNMASISHLTGMAWDYRDELQSTSKQAVGNNATPETTYYVYDASGDRTRKVTERFASAGSSPTLKKQRVYLGPFEIYREYDGTGQNVTLERECVHVMDGHNRILMIETKTVGQSLNQYIRYQFTNNLGSAVLELDDKAQVISYEEYYPYGSTSYQAIGQKIEAPKRYRYTGKERDEENDFYHMGARYYAPWLGRWTACDPKLLKPGAGNASCSQQTMCEEKTAEKGRGSLGTTADSAGSSQSCSHTGIDAYDYCGDNPICNLDASGCDWIKYDGKVIHWYGGNYGDTKVEKFHVPGTSGLEGHQTSDQTNYKPDEEGGGPSPAGHYDVDLTKNPARVAGIVPLPDGDARVANRQGADAGGIERIPTVRQDMKRVDPRGLKKLEEKIYRMSQSEKKSDRKWAQDQSNELNSTDFQPWGTWRAKLNKVEVDTKRDSMYFHDSDKGESHGCVETTAAGGTKLHDELIKYGKTHPKIDVMVKYPPRKWDKKHKKWVYPSTRGATGRHP